MVKYSFAKYYPEFKPPSYFLDHFEELKTSRKPFEFRIVRRMPNGDYSFGTKLTVSMESYTVAENVNEGFDLKVSIKLKQYKHFGTKLIKVSNDSTTATIETKRETENSPEPKQDTTYTVQNGDTLYNIAKKFYGDGSKYTLIYEANKDKIQKPSLIYAGQVLVIPNASGTTATTATVSPSGSPVRTPNASKSVTAAGSYSGGGTGGGSRGSSGTCRVRVNSIGDPCGGRIVISYYDVNKNYTVKNANTSSYATTQTTVDVANGTKVNVKVEAKTGKGAGSAYVTTSGSWSKSSSGLDNYWTYTCNVFEDGNTIYIHWGLKG
jgi:LysM repeat protein